jgi:hypothetical protein
MRCLFVTGAYLGHQIVFHHAQTFETQIWTMAGTNIVRRDTVHDEFDHPIFVGPPFFIVGACSKFSTTGNPSIVWHNDTTGETQIWIMNENTFSGIGGIKISKRRTVLDESRKPIFVGPPFRIVGMANFHGDPSLHDVGDIVWHNDSTGETQIWIMEDDGVRIARRQTVVDENRKPILVKLPFHIVGVATPRH